MSGQNEMMLVDPTTGTMFSECIPEDYRYADKYRQYFGRIAWLFNPWTCMLRDISDINADPTGILISVRKDELTATETPSKDIEFDQHMLVETNTDYVHLRAVICQLYKILDDIDTATDVAKSDNKFYREIVERLQAEKNKYIITDGYKLYLKKED